MLFNGALIYAHSRQQTVVATSSAEAEYYALSSGAAETLGVVSLLQELQLPCIGQLHCDSSSGRALACRTGFGRVKHVDIRLLWLQEVIASGRLLLKPVSTEANLADIGTKPLSAQRLEELCMKLGL
jgi:hypothetical protein